MQKPHKILLTGTFSSGKTTLLNELGKNPEFITIQEVARDLLMIYPTLERKPEFQDMLFEEQIKREQIAENTAIKLGLKTIICDRGILDIIAYSEVLGHQIKPEWVTSLYQRYGLVLIFDKSDIKFVRDIKEIELSTVIYRDNLDRKIREVVQRFRFPYYEISGENNRRLQETESILHQHASRLEARRRGKEM